jgi:hypothetical protein
MPERSLAPRGLHAWQQGSVVIVGEGKTIDDVQESGRWIKTADPVEVEA